MTLSGNSVSPSVVPHIARRTPFGHVLPTSQDHLKKNVQRGGEFGVATRRDGFFPPLDDQRIMVILWCRKPYLWFCYRRLFYWWFCYYIDQAEHAHPRCQSALWTFHSVNHAGPRLTQKRLYSQRAARMDPVRSVGLDPTIPLHKHVLTWHHSFSLQIGFFSGFIRSCTLFHV